MAHVWTMIDAHTSPTTKASEYFWPAAFANIFLEQSVGTVTYIMRRRAFHTSSKTKSVYLQMMPVAN